MRMFPRKRCRHVHPTAQKQNPKKKGHRQPPPNQKKKEETTTKTTPTPPNQTKTTPTNPPPKKKNPRWLVFRCSAAWRPASSRRAAAWEFSGDLGSNVSHCSLGQCSNSKLDNNCKRVGTPSYLYKAKAKDTTGPRSSGKHGNATMLQLRLATSGEVLSAAIGREPCRVPEPHRCLHSKLVFEGAQRRSGVVDFFVLCSNLTRVNQHTLGARRPTCTEGTQSPSQGRPGATICRQNVGHTCPGTQCIAQGR